MRNLVAGFAMSLDGYVEGPHGEFDWIIYEKEVDYSSHISRFDTFLFGRKSYEKFFRLENTLFPGIKNYVISNSLDQVGKGFHLLKGDVAELIASMKRLEGKEIALYGGPILLTSLLNWRLVDELTMSVIPVMLGHGKRMVDLLNERVILELVDLKRFSGGTVMLSYKII